MNDDQEPSERRRPKWNKLRRWLMRPTTIRIAFAIVKFVWWLFNRRDD